VQLRRANESLVTKRVRVIHT